MPAVVQGFAGFDATAQREFFFAKACSNGRSTFDITACGTARLLLLPDVVAHAPIQHVTAVVELLAGSGGGRREFAMDRDAISHSGALTLLIDVPPRCQLRVYFRIGPDARRILSRTMDLSPQKDANTAKPGVPIPAYVARVTGRMHQGTEGVGGRSACTAIAAYAALHALSGHGCYWDPKFVDEALLRGAEAYDGYMAGPGAGPAGVEHTEFDRVARAAPGIAGRLEIDSAGDGILTTDGRAFEELARALWKAGRHGPQGLALTCHQQTLVAVALPGAPAPELVRAVERAYQEQGSGWRPPPLAALPCTLLLFDSHRHTAERGGPRDAAWLLFPSPEALAAYLGLERFPCYESDDPDVTDMELMYTRQFSHFQFHCSAAPATPQAPAPQRTPSSAAGGGGGGAGPSASSPLEHPRAQAAMEELVQLRAEKEALLVQIQDEARRAKELAALEEKLIELEREREEVCGRRRGAGPSSSRRP